MTVETRPIEVEPRTKTVSDVLRHAARIIEEEGWNPHRLLGDDNSVCLVGAIHWARSGPPKPVNHSGRGIRSGHWDFLTVKDVVDRLNPFTFPLRPADWNDTPGRTAAEVIAALRAAADEADR